MIETGKDVSKDLRRSLKKHTGSAMEWAAACLKSDETAELLKEYLKAVSEMEIGTRKLNADLVYSKDVYKQNKLNEFYRPPGVEAGCLFKADYMDNEGQRIKSHSFLEKRFEEYSFSKSTVSGLLDVALS